MRLRALRIDGGTDTRGCLSLPECQRQSASASACPCPVTKDRPVGDRLDKQFTRLAEAAAEVTVCVCLMRRSHLSFSEVGTGRAFSQTRHA